MKTKELYGMHVAELRRATEQTVDLLRDDTLRTFTFFSANMYHFLPMLEMQHHRTLFRQNCFYQNLQTVDAHYFAQTFPLRIYGWKCFERLISRRHGLICTYHFGAYQLINYLLAEVEIPYCLLVAGHVVNTWKDRYPGLMALQRKAEEAGRFVLLDANDRGALREIYRLTRQGFYTLIYVDGFEGMTGPAQRTRQTVPFLGQEITVPAGAAQLSYSMDVPIYPVLMRRQAQSIRMYTEDAIVPDGIGEKSIYMRMVMERMYSWLAPFVLHWPDQWTNWPYLHLITRQHRLHRNAGWKELAHRTPLDQMEYGIYRLDGRVQLLRKRDMAVFPITEQDYAALKRDWYAVH